MAKKSKVVDNATKLNSWEEVDATIAKIAQLKHAAQSKIHAYNKAEHERREKVSAEVSPMLEKVDELGKSILRFAEDNRQDFEGKTKKLTHGSVSFRTTPPAVKTMKGFTLASALELVKRSVERCAQFVRTKQELDKEQILRSYALWSNTAEEQTLPEGAISEEQLAELGLQVTQDESFYYEEVDAIALENLGY